MFNPDGTEAEMCGNGLRCAGRYAIDMLNKTTVSVATGNTVLSVSAAEPLLPDIATYIADIGPVSLDTSSLPMVTKQATHCHQPITELSDTQHFTALSIPNPHLIAFVTQYDLKRLQDIGHKANNTPIFPHGVNVSFATKLRHNTLFVATYERGAGITEACGTAMSAASFCSVQRQMCQPEQGIAVYNQGGMVQCTVFPEQNKVTLTGNATFLSNHRVHLASNCRQIISQTTERVYTAEIQAYAKLKQHAMREVEAISRH
jgi:diaminopimelate epimerase